MNLQMLKFLFASKLFSNFITRRKSVVTMKSKRSFDITYQVVILRKDHKSRGKIAEKCGIGKSSARGKGISVLIRQGVPISCLRDKNDTLLCQNEPQADYCKLSMYFKVSVYVTTIYRGDFTISRSGFIFDWC